MTTEGTCPVCGRAIRVRTGRMVHHGISLPDRGRLVGDCFGNCYGGGHEPYEVSCAGAHAYRDRILVPRLRSVEDFLARLEAGQVEPLYREARVPVPTTALRAPPARFDPGWATWWMAVWRDPRDRRRKRLWRDVYASTHRETRSDIRRLRFEIERCDHLIRVWSPGDLRETARAPPGLPHALRRRRRRRSSRDA